MLLLTHSIITNNSTRYNKRRMFSYITEIKTTHRFKLDITDCSVKTQCNSNILNFKKKPNKLSIQYVPLLYPNRQIELKEVISSSF